MRSAQGTYTHVSKVLDPGEAFVARVRVHEIAREHGLRAPEGGLDGRTAPRAVGPLFCSPFHASRGPAHAGTSTTRPGTLRRFCRLRIITTNGQIEWIGHRTAPPSWPSLSLRLV